ncbi:MAG: tetratricopeptide repeat protein, partial [Blastocatellia bacterium]|nr:tetratricopeptide repeat protein [Blastocatellia bacterium]
MAEHDETIRLAPKTARYYSNRGVADNGQGDYDRAIVDLDQALNLNPNLANAYSHRGFAYGQKGNFDRTRPDWTRRLRSIRNRPE